MALRHSDAIEVKRVKGKGRGVFALRAIPEGEIIEEVPVLVLSTADIEDAEGWNGLAAYCFDWQPGKVALALGYGSLYNHSYRPNAIYEDTSRPTKIYRAIRPIRAGEEITINYNGEARNSGAVGFEVVESKAPPKRPKRAEKKGGD